MKVKIKGFNDLESAKYVFDNSGNLIGVRLDADAANGVYNVFPMELVEDIYDD
ncbi:MAG: hypothetical protein K2G58_01530 [Alistipes sp.]|nr:hypothetical protein [Alistipes sp.]